MELFPIIAVLAMQGLGFCLMLAAFILIALRGGWQRAMQPDGAGHWPLPRYLMLIGASLALLCCGLVSVPGVIPWWDYSQLHTRVPGIVVASTVAIMVPIVVLRRRRSSG